MISVLAALCSAVNLSLFAADLTEQQREGREVVRQILLDQTPTENSSITGVLKIRAKGAKPEEVPVKCEVILTATNWQVVYSSQFTNSAGGDMNFDRSHFNQLTILHTDAQPNRYLFPNVNRSPTDTNQFHQPKPEQLFAPFAGSDFWVADLGLEFLHWPDQRLLKKELRSSVSCYRLESVNPDPAPGAYARVLLWLMIEPPHGIVHAEAYDAAGKLMKEFDPKDLEKVNGQYQVQTLEIRNVKTGSRTRLEFNFDQK